MIKYITATLLLLLMLGCAKETIEVDGIRVKVEMLPDSKYLVTVGANDSTWKQIHLNPNGEVERVVSPIEHGYETLSFDPATGYLSTKVIRDTLEQIQGVAYDFSRYGYLKGAYKMKDDKNDEIGFLYSDGLNSLDAVFLYDSLGNLAETKDY